MNQKPFKPMLARDWIESKVKLPCIIQPKVDGVRALNRNGKLLARSLKPHDNLHVTKLFSKPEFHGFDGEMILGDNPRADNLCSLTSGAMRRYDSVDVFTWILFDYVTDKTQNLPYTERMKALDKHIDTLPLHLIANLNIIPSYDCTTIQQVNQYRSNFLDEGFEGSIIRAASEPYKIGRSDSKMQVWRIKDFIDAEFIIDEILEGQHNGNEATTNELGRTERSSHQENMTPNGMVGKLKGRMLEDVLHPQTGQVLFKKNEVVVVSAGAMSHEDRKHYFENPSELLNKIGKMKTFPQGVKDKPRFPTFLSVRNESDMS